MIDDPICTRVHEMVVKLVRTNKFKDVKDSMRRLITDYVEKMPAGGVALVSEIRTAVNENVRSTAIPGQIRDNRTVAEVLRELIHKYAVGSLKMDKHGDQFFKARPMEMSNLANDVTNPHVVTVVTVASTDGGSSVTCAEWKKYLVVNETTDSGSPLASATFNVVPPTSGTIVVQSGTIVAKNFFDTQYL